MITEEQDALALTLGLSRGLNPLAPARALPDGSDEAKRATLGIRAVVLAHDRLDGLGSLIGVVEGDGRDVVVQHVRLNDAVQKVAPDEAEFAVDGGGGAAGKGPGVGFVVGERRVGVLEEGDGDYCTCKWLVFFS